MHDKMNDPECVTRKVKIAPHDYSKENLLATFTPQKQLTPEQIFWSNDFMKMKSEALKERTKRITPSAITDGERGFEQTKACYLQEVISFFKTHKDNFEVIQKALTKEVKEMKDVFEELEAEVAQYVVDKKHDAIELKNLLIANDNLIVECLSQEVFCVATNSKLNVARFTDMNVANTTAETRCLALKAELANLHETNNQDNQKELINNFSKLETTDSQITKLTDQVTHLQAQNDMFRAKNNKIKQHYTELYDSIEITRAKHIEQVTKVTTKNMNLKTGVSKATVNPLVSARDKHAIDVKPIVPRLRNNRNAHLDYLRHLKESVEMIRDIVEEAKVVSTLDRSIVFACRYTKHSQELLEYTIGTCSQGSQQRAKQLAHIPLIRKKQVIVAQPSNKLDSTTYLHVVTVTSQKTNVPVPPSTGVDCCHIASGSQLMSHVKPNRTSPAKGDTKLPVDDQPKKNKSHLRTSNRIDSSSRLKRTVINLHSNSVCQTCAKCLTPFNHNLCVATYLQSAMATPSIRYNRSVERKVKQVWKPKPVRQVWKPTGKVLTTIDKMADVNAPSGQTPTMALPEALQITPVNRNQAFAAPPSIDGLIDFVNQLGNPKLVMNLSTVVTNDLFQLWRALLTIINLYLTGKTSGFERSRAPVLQILWGIVTRANIDYAERIWEEFTQSIHTFIEDKRNLSRHTSGKNRATLIVISSIRFTKLIIHHLQKKHRMPIPSRLITENIQEASYYQEYQENVAKHRGFLADETGSTQDLPPPKPAKPARKPQSTIQKAPLKPSISSPVTSTQPAPTSAPAKSQENKRKQATGTTDKPAKAKRIKHSVSRKTRQPRRSPKSVGASEAEEVTAEEPQVANEDADYQKAVEESMKDAYALPKGALPPVVIMEPESGKYQPLPEVPGKGKAKVTKEQVAHDLLSLQKHKKTSPTDQYIFQRRVSEPTASSFHDEFLYEVLGQSDSEEESEKIMLGVEKGGQDEGQAGPDPDAQAEDQTGSNAGAQAEGQAGSNPDETSEGQAGSNPNETSEGQAGPDPETKVESMVNVTIQQALSLISLMTSPIIDLTSRLESPKEHQQLKATTTNTTTTTTTTTLPPPQAPQQSTTEVMMVKRISELEHILADLIQVNKTMEERLDKHGARLYTLEQLDIPQQVSIAVSEVVTNAVDWAMQAPLRNRFRDLPEADMKEILHQRMWEFDSYKSHEDHMQLFEALEKSINRDHSEDLVHDLAEARKKRKKGRESPKPPPGSPSHQPPPLPLPAGPSRMSGAPRDFGSQVTPPPPPPTSTNQDSPSKDFVALSPSKTAATTEHQAWTTPDVTLKPLMSLTPANLDMDEAMGLDEQA
uniref:Integrase, catalytic region, zinc finger, CCHC-type, peptidase aspartic, catalytic n=1 Tax=Tanacetum cinerariifolium TaxID=118510 RepID=A0A6L2MYL3_TANCI|nr:hypothetical protein [Tanacetum cinerariifolium]